MTLHSSSIVTMPLIYCRFRDVAAHWSKIATPRIWRPCWGWSRQIWAMTLGDEKPEWCVYQIVKEFWWCVQTFWHRQMDRRKWHGICVVYMHCSIYAVTRKSQVGCTLQLADFLALVDICFRVVNTGMSCTYRSEPLSCINQTLTLSLCHFKEQ